MSFCTYWCHMLTGDVLEWNFNLKWLIQTLPHNLKYTSSQFCMFMKMVQHSKCNELTGVLWRLQSNFNVFDHFSLTKVAETFCGCCHPPSSTPRQTWHPRDHPWTPVNSLFFECSSITMSSWNWTKLQHLMSDSFHHTFDSKFQPETFPTQQTISVCAKWRYLRQALYFKVIGAQFRRRMCSF